MSINGFLQPHQGIPSTKNYQARHGSKAPLGYTTGLGRDLLMAFVIANSTDSQGDTALINAIQADSMEIAWMLIENGADLNAQNPNGSRGDIAGVLSENRRVLGLMPHPERAVDAGHGGTDGQALFRALIGEVVAA